MNLGNEGQWIMTAEMITRIIEEQDAFIIQHISPYLEEETGRRIDKQELKKALIRNTPEMVRGHGECPVCGLDLVNVSYAIRFGVEYCPRCGQRAKWPEYEGSDPE